MKKVINVAAVLTALSCLVPINGLAEYVEDMLQLNSYMRSVGVCYDDNGVLAFSDKQFFTSAEPIFMCGLTIRQDGIQLRKIQGSEKNDRMFELAARVLCKGKGRTAIMFGRGYRDGARHVFIFGRDGLVADCRNEQTDTNVVLIVECRLSGEVRDMLKNEGCAEQFPSRMFGIDLKSEMPDPSQMVEDAQVVKNGDKCCSIPRCKDAVPIHVQHEIFTEMVRSFEKGTGRLCSIELQSLTDEDSSVTEIFKRVWTYYLPMSGFCGGGMKEGYRKNRYYGFDRVDGIRATLSVSRWDEKKSVVRLSVELPADFEISVDKNRRKNGWRNPKFMDF